MLEKGALMYFIKKLVVVWFITVTSLTACHNQSSQESKVQINQSGEARENVGTSLNQNVTPPLNISAQLQALASGIAEHLDY